MNHILQSFARQWLMEHLAQCTDAQNLIFNRMYSHKNLDASLVIVVGAMPADKLDWAMMQVESTLKKNGAS